ncbi:MAG: hypothetical protein R3F43_21445 [bacterium]
MAPPEDPPPLLGTWPRLYALVLLNLALMVFGFWLFERVFG